MHYHHTTIKNNIKPRIKNNIGDRLERIEPLPEFVVSSEKIEKDVNQPTLQAEIVLSNPRNTLPKTEKIQALESDLMPLKQKLKDLPMLEKGSFYNTHMLVLDEKLHELKFSFEQNCLADLKKKLEDGVISKAELKAQQKKTLEVKLTWLNVIESELNYKILRDSKLGDGLTSTLEKNRCEMSDIELEIKKLMALDGNMQSGKLSDYLNRQGQRPISHEQANWLKAEIVETVNPVDEEKTLDIANEIAYQVRFGNLQVSYKTRKPMSVKHGIHIALKTLRDGVWTRPNGMVV